MNPEESKLRQSQESEETGQESSEQSRSEKSLQQEAREFATVEELLRHDSSGNPVPPEVAERVNQSIAAEPPKGTSWLKKMFGK